MYRNKLTQENLKNHQLQKSYSRILTEVEAPHFSQQRLQDLFELAPDGYFLNDLKGKFIDGNKAMTDMLGYTRNELVGKNFLKKKIFPKDQIGYSAAAYSKNLLNKATGPDEVKLRRKDGSEVHVEIHTQLIEIAGEKFVLGVIRDITRQKMMESELAGYRHELERQYEERIRKLTSTNTLLQQEIQKHREQEEALRASEEKLSKLIEVSTDLVFQLSPKGKIKFVSPNITRKYGYKPEELIGKSLQVTTPLQELPRVKNALKRLIAGESLHNFVVMQKTKMKQIITMEINAVPLLKNGNVIGIQGIMRDITERYKAERVLRESEEKYRDLVERADIGILIDDKHGNFEYFNRTFADFFGYSMEEMANLNISQIVHPSDIRKVMKNHHERLRGLRSRSVYDFQGIRKDGTSIFIEVDVAPVKEGKDIIGTRSYLWDITQRKKAEMALQKSEKRNRELYRNMREAVFIFDLEGNIQEWNPQFSKILGYTGEELDQMNWRDITAAEHIRSGEKIIANQVLKQSYSDLYETVFVTNKGKKIPAEARIYLITNDEQEPTGFWVFFRDLSMQKKIEQEVYMLAQTVKSVREFICVTDLNENILFVNDALLKTYGYRRNELIGKKITILRSKRNDSELLKKIHVQSCAGGWEGELLNRKNDGSEFPIFLSTSLILDPSGRPLALVGVSSDISERKKIEAQLRQAQKMEAVGQLAGGIAHDFNNILTAINGYAELAIMRMESKNPLFKEITGILKAGKRAGSLVRQLLAFSRKQMVELRIVDVNHLIVDLDKMLHRLIGEDIHVEIKLDPELSKIKADPGQIEQILVNLVVNARDAVNSHAESASEKRIAIETTNVTLDKRFTLEHPGSHMGHHICIKVSDTGIGMDEPTKAKIFEPFFTTKEKIRGTGLGLATVYGIVKQNYGSIFVSSEPHKGTTIKVYWPGAEEKEISFQSVAENPEVEKGKETLLYVEDNSDVRDFTVEALKMLGYHVYKADNGREARQMLEENNHKIDLLITDVIMPEMGGMELAKYVKSVHPNTLILFTSGYTDDHIVHDSSLDEGIHFLHKPYSIEALSEKVREVLKAKN